ncbi:cytochrome P450 [Streptomyces hirsutus]
MDTLASVPLAPGSVPFLGHVLAIARDPMGFVVSLPARGDLVWLRLGPHPVLMVCHPELTRQVLVDDRTFDKGGPLLDLGRELLGDGLATCPYSQHRRQRRLCQPAFHSDRLQTYTAAMTSAAEAAADSWQDGQVLDIGNEMSALTLRIAVETMFSVTMPPQIIRNIVDDLGTVLNGTFLQMVRPEILNRMPTGGNRAYHRALSRLRGTVAEVIEDRRTTATDYGDLLSALLSAHDPDSSTASTMTARELADQVLTFFVAGAETTASALTWALYQLSQHAEIQDRVHAEVDTNVSRAATPFDRLPLLDLTTRVVTETLRLHTPAWMVTRITTAETTLAGIPLPAGTSIGYSPRLIHHRPDLYEEPERFDPDRWPDAHRDRTAFLPFGSGARKCIGERFAQTEAALVLAAIAARWTLEPVAHPPARLALKDVLIPPGLLMRVSPRRAAHSPHAPRTA